MGAKPRKSAAARIRELERQLARARAELKRRKKPKAKKPKKPKKPTKPTPRRPVRKPSKPTPRTATPRKPVAPPPAPTPPQREPLPKPLAERTDRALARVFGVKPATIARWRRDGMPPSRRDDARAAVARREVQLAARAFDHLRAYRAGERPHGNVHYHYDLYRRAKRALYREFGARHARHRLDQIAYDAGWSTDHAAHFARLS